MGVAAKAIIEVMCVGVDVYNAETQDAEADSDAQVPASIDRASAQSTPELSEADSDSSLDALL